MKAFVVGFLLLILGITALAQRGPIVAGSSAPDPFALSVGNGELAEAIPGFTSTNGKVQKSSVISAPTTTAVILTIGQSLIATSSLGTYTTVNGASDNFNIYDGGIYGCSNIILGAAWAPATGSNSPNCVIADSLITAGTYTRVIMASIGIGGTPCAVWDTGGALRNRITVLMRRLQAKSLTPATGFVGDVWVLLHYGETDAVIGTTQAAMATCIRNMDTAFTADGLTNYRLFVPTESFILNTTHADIQNGQADAVASGCSKCRQGANWDSLLTATNRQGGGTDAHLTQTGNLNAAALDVTVIQNCKNTAC